MLENAHLQFMADLEILSAHLRHSGHTPKLLHRFRMGPLYNPLFSLIFFNEIFFTISFRLFLLEVSDFSGLARIDAHRHGSKQRGLKNSIVETSAPP